MRRYEIVEEYLSESPSGEWVRHVDVQADRQELLQLLAAAKLAMERWGAEEDGVPEDGLIAEIYGRLCARLKLEGSHG